MSKLNIYIDGCCIICLKFKKFVTTFDLFNFINIYDIRKMENVDVKKLKLMYSVSTSGKEFYGFESLFEINKRLIVLWIFFPITFLFKITKIGNLLYNELSTKRKIIPFNCDENCKLEF